MSSPPKLWPGLQSCLVCSCSNWCYTSFCAMHCSGKATAAASQVAPIHPMYQISSNYLSNPPKLSPGLQGCLVCSCSWCRLSPLFCTLAQFLQQSSQLFLVKKASLTFYCYIGYIYSSFTPHFKSKSKFNLTILTIPVVSTIATHWLAVAFTIPAPIFLQKRSLKREWV